jgi:hypothetical protein
MNTFDLQLALGDLNENDDYSDVDALFAMLETIAPPVNLIERVMDAVMRLPLPIGEVEVSDDDDDDEEMQAVI